MSTSRALPVLRPPDRQALHDTARLLLDFTEPWGRVSVDCHALGMTSAEARQVLEAFPGSWVSPSDRTHPESSAEVRALFETGDPRVDELAPFDVDVFERPPGSVEERFLGIVGSGPAALYWGGFAWPAVPELDLKPRAKDAHLQIVLNSRNADFDRPSEDHTLFIHFRSGDLERAEWLARQAGLTPVGPDESGC
ncbi:hypothetical protein ACFV0O_10925 [Kitasatospora sp. NPDC059577]|uniref:hypothetical protein n=1 Tax=Kitasatospora sp. NPDC059577 TaxID=3346873 RepID=UPI0036991D23